MIFATFILKAQNMMTLATIFIMSPLTMRRLEEMIGIIGVYLDYDLARFRVPSMGAV